MDKKYLFDLSKIIESAFSGDLVSVAAYTNQLCDRLEADGDADGARRLRKILSPTSKASKLTLARGSIAPESTLPLDSESRLTTADEEFHAKGTVPLFLPTSAEKTVNQFLTYYRASAELAASGVAHNPTMLICGPPGCGKTQLGRYIASELGLPLLTGRVDGLISSYLGSTSKNLRALFEHARSRPCVFFLDEFDAIAKMRDDPKELGELKRVVISLLQNIDALGSDHVLLAATNHEHLLDPAIWRRFAYKLTLHEPDALTREKMIRQFLGRFAHEELVEVLSALGDGLTGAQIRLIAEDCIRHAVLSRSDRISLKDAVEIAIPFSPHTGQQNVATAAEQIKVLRSVNGKVFTQTKLGAIFGMAQSHVSNILKGKAR